MSLTRRGLAHLLLAAGLGVGVLSTSIGSSVAADDPTDFVTAIYQRYEDGGEGVSLDNAQTVRALFEPRLADMIIADSDEAAATGDVPRIDGDAFIDAQDWDITELRVSVEERSLDRAEGHVAFLNFGEPKRIDLQLVRGEDGGWRIRDILWAESSLRGLYTH